MNARALLVLGALLVSPAWADEPSFDLKSDALRKIVHDIASSQSTAAQLSEAKPVARESDQTIHYVPPEKAPLMKTIAPRPSAAAPTSGILSDVIDTVVETLIDSDDDGDYMREQYKVWRACHARDPDCRLPPPPDSH